MVCAMHQISAFGGSALLSLCHAKPGKPHCLPYVAAASLLDTCVIAERLISTSSECMQNSHGHSMLTAYSLQAGHGGGDPGIQ